MTEEAWGKLEAYRQGHGLQVRNITTEQADNPEWLQRLKTLYDEVVEVFFDEQMAFEDDQR